MQDDVENTRWPRRRSKFCVTHWQRATSSTADLVRWISTGWERPVESNRPKRDNPAPRGNRRCRRFRFAMKIDYGAALPEIPTVGATAGVGRYPVQPRSRNC